MPFCFRIFNGGEWNVHTAYFTIQQFISICKPGIMIIWIIYPVVLSLESILLRIIVQTDVERNVCSAGRKFIYLISEWYVITFRNEFFISVVSSRIWNNYICIKFFCYKIITFFMSYFNPYSFSVFYNYFIKNGFCIIYWFKYLLINHLIFIHF